MAETLIERIRRIENVPDYISINRDQEMREEFEKEALNRSFSEVKGGSSFLKKFYEVTAQYESLSKAGTLPQSFIEEVADLDACVGSRLYTISDASNINAPEILGIGGSMVGAVGGLAVNIREGSGTFRRRFIINPVIWGLGFGSLSALIGAALEPSETERRLNILEQNARELDKVYNRLYPSATAQKEPLILDRRWFFNTLYQRA